MDAQLVEKGVTEIVRAFRTFKGGPASLLCIHFEALRLVICGMMIADAKGMGAKTSDSHEQEEKGFG